MNDTKKLPLVGISIGDINGIGMEVILKTFSDSRVLNFCTPVIYGSTQITNYHKKTLGLHNLQVNFSKELDKVRPNTINVLNTWPQEPKVELGKATEAAGEFALISLDTAIGDLKEGKLDAIVTAPINKKAIQSEKFNFPGHTEFLKERFNTSEVVMFLVEENLKVAVATGHVPLKNVAEELTEEVILNKLRIINDSLIRDFNIQKPKIGVLGLNPHAGEEGLLGNEEEAVISPAIEKARKDGILAFGPFPGDGYFGTAHYKNFDATLAMYHDQGLIPFKALAFERGVNFTAGLPVVRTSPDHGTGYGIAGKNEANEMSFREAVLLAVKIIENRQLYSEITANPLESRMIKEKEAE